MITSSLRQVLTMCKLRDEISVLRDLMERFMSTVTREYDRVRGT